MVSSSLHLSTLKHFLPRYEEAEEVLQEERRLADRCPGNKSGRREGREGMKLERERRGAGADNGATLFCTEQNVTTSSE